MSSVHLVFSSVETARKMKKNRNFFSLEHNQQQKNSQTKSKVCPNCRVSLTTRDGKRGGAWEHCS